MAKSEKSLSSLGQPFLGAEGHPQKYLRKPPVDMFWVKLMALCAFTSCIAVTVAFCLISADEGVAFLSRKDTGKFLSQLESTISAFTFFEFTLNVSFLKLI